MIPTAAWMRSESTGPFLFFSLDGRTRSQPSSASGHADRIAFLFWFQFGCGDKCSGPGSTWTLTEGEEGLSQSFSLPSAWRETWKCLHDQDECCCLLQKSKIIWSAKPCHMDSCPDPFGFISPVYLGEKKKKKSACGKIAGREQLFQNQFRW